MFGDGLSDGWVFFSWKGSYGTPIFTAGWGSNDIFSSSAMSLVQPNSWMEPTWSHHGVTILSFVWYFKKNQFLLVGDINPSKKYVLKESKNPKTNKFQHMSHKAVQGTSIDIALFEIRKGRGFQCGHLR